MSKADDRINSTIRISRPALADSLYTSRNFGRTLDLGLGYDVRSDRCAPFVAVDMEALEAAVP